MKSFPSSWYQNLSSLILAFILALLIWITATNLELEQIKFPPDAPYLEINLINQSEGLVVAEVDQKFAQVDVRLSKEQTLQRSDLIVEADLSDLGPGLHQVEVQVRSQPFAPRTNVLDKIPNRINVRLDQVITKTFEIEPRIKDESTIPQTAQVLSNTVSPPFVTITGPQGVIEKIDRVLAETELEGASESIEKLVVPFLSGLPNNTDLSRLEIEPKSVMTTVKIEQRPGYRDLIIKTNLENQPEKGYWVSEVSVQPQLVTVVGKPTVISELDGLADTEPIDIAGLQAGEFIRDIRLQLPEGVSPLQENFVKVTIKIEPQTSSKRFRLVPTITGLKSGLVVKPETIIPSLVNVLMTGSVIELEELNLDDIAITLDTTNLPSGSHQIEPNITSPGSLNVESVNPQLIEITIEQEQISRQIEVPIQLTDPFSNTIAVITPETLRVDLKGPPPLIENLKIEDIKLIVDVSNLKVGKHQVIPQFDSVQELTLQTPLQPVNITVYDLDELIVLLEQVKIVNLADGLRGTLNQGVVQLYIIGPDEIQKVDEANQIDQTDQTSKTEDENQTSKAEDENQTEQVEEEPTPAKTLSENDDFKIEIDLANLGQGDHFVRPTISLPNGYTLIYSEPKQIQIRLLPKEN